MDSGFQVRICRIRVQPQCTAAHNELWYKRWSVTGSIFLCLSFVHCKPHQVYSTMPSNAHRDRKAGVRCLLQPILDRYPSWYAARNGRPARLSYKRGDTTFELQSMHAMPGGPPLNVWASLPDVLLTDSTAVEDFVRGGSSVCLVRPEVSCLLPDLL